MLNQVILVGKVKSFHPELNSLQLEVESPEDIQIIPVYIPDNLADQTADYLKVRFTVGIKAKLESDFGVNVLVVAEKITFIKSET